MVDSTVVENLIDGIGNQIFTGAAALEPARWLGVDLGLNTSWFVTWTTRF